MKKIFSMVIVVLSVLLIGCSGDKKEDGTKAEKPIVIQFGHDNNQEIQFKRRHYTGQKYFLSVAMGK